MLSKQTPSLSAAGDMLTLKIASKVAMAEAFFGKNITFPLNQLTACPKSRCNLVTGVSNTTVTSLLSGVPLFDLFTKLGVKLGLGANQLLTFDVTKLNKVRLLQCRSSHRCGCSELPTATGSVGYRICLRVAWWR